MKRCKRCVYPDTVANLTFNEEGVCSACLQDDVKKFEIDWSAREEQLRRILGSAKEKANGGYDCIAPVSFGKDSTFILYTLRKTYNMNPLAVTFNHMWFTDVIIENSKKVCEKLGVDQLMLSPNYDVVKKLVRKSIERLGDVCWHCHAGVGAFPFQIAVKYRIPLIVWGEPPAEYGEGSYSDIQVQDAISFRDRFVKGLTADELVDDDISLSELQPYIFPSEEELKDAGIKGIFLGSYIPWNVGKQVELIKKELDWQGARVEGCFEDYDNVECKYIGAHDYGCYLKRGYGRATSQACFAIREGRMTREEGLKLVGQYNGKKPESLTLLLEEIDMSEEEYIDAHNRFRVTSDDR